MHEGETLLQCPNRATKEMLEERSSPFLANNYHGGGFVCDQDRVDIQSIHFANRLSQGARSQSKLNELSVALGGVSLEMDKNHTAVRAGPRSTIYFNPQQVNAALVTCGSLCPGLNDVIRAIVHKLLDYGVPETQIFGIQGGFKGFYDKKRKPIILKRSMVDSIQLEGGTVLGTGGSTEEPDIQEIVKRLDLNKIDFLFVIGGPGSFKGALGIQHACQENRVPCSIIAVPKSIDNDILLVDKTFGFETAVEEAQKPLMAAKVEASSGYRGVGLVKLMGRRSGFIAVSASLASGLVDICLIPEVSYRLESVLAYLEYILEKKGHAVICVAEGAGEGLMDVDSTDKPKTGRGSMDDPNLTGNLDIGAWLKAKIISNLSDVDVKYIDPSYLIRSVQATATDRVYCKILANSVVHAAFAGYTGCTAGLVNTHFVYLPISAVIQSRRHVDPHGELWNRLRSSIGQPNFEEEVPLGGYLGRDNSNSGCLTPQKSDTLTPTSKYRP